MQIEYILASQGRVYPVCHFNILGYNLPSRSREGQVKYHKQPNKFFKMVASIPLIGRIREKLILALKCLETQTVLDSVQLSRLRTPNQITSGSKNKLVCFKNLQHKNQFTKIETTTQITTLVNMEVYMYRVSCFWYPIFIKKLYMMLNCAIIFFVSNYIS